MTTIVTHGLQFVCETGYERWRAQTLLTKEPGTLRWLQQIQPGDVFYDVGANVGCYTLLAAHRGAIVYAFEPHEPTRATLRRNVIANGFAHRVSVWASALGDRDGKSAFRASSAEAGSSGHTLVDVGDPTHPVTTLDTLIQAGATPPTFLKIDVDGRELAILRGGFTLLRSLAAPHSIQVETAPESRADIIGWLAVAGYDLIERHRTKAGEVAVAKGTDPDRVTDNAVFTRAV